MNCQNSLEKRKTPTTSVSSTWGSTRPPERALFSEEANIAKKALGSAHIAIGSGLFYGQDVDSPVHIDLVMDSPTIAVDGAIQFDDGELLT